MQCMSTSHYYSKNRIGFQSNNASITNCVFLHIKTLQIQQSTIHIFAIVSLFHFTLCLQSLQDINMKYSLKSSEKITRLSVRTCTMNVTPAWPYLLVVTSTLTFRAGAIHEHYFRTFRSFLFYFNSEFPSRFCKRYFRTSRSSCCYIDSECPCNC